MIVVIHRHVTAIVQPRNDGILGEALVKVLGICIRSALPGTGQLDRIGKTDAPVLNRLMLGVGAAIKA